MAGYSDSLSRLRGGGEPAVSTDLRTAIAETLTAEETVCEELTSNTGLRRPEGEDLLADEGDGAAVAVTDRRVVVGVGTPDGPVVVTEGYTTVKSVSHRNGVLRTSLEIDRWGAGPLRLQPSTGDVEAAAAKISQYSDVWDRVETELNRAGDEISVYARYMSAGDVETAIRHRAETERHLDAARDAIEAAPVTETDGLTERVRDLEEQLAKARVRGRVDHSQQCRERAGREADRGNYREAHAAYREARRSLEVAYEVTTEWDFRSADPIRSAAADLADEIEALEAEPLEAGREAHQAARTAESLERGIVHWVEALENYRSAMSAGWGIEGADFDGDREELAARIETIVWELVDGRCALAENLVSEGDELSMAADNRTAKDRYHAAAQQVAAALELADQYRAGDPERLRERLAEIKRRRTGLGAERFALA